MKKNKRKMKNLYLKSYLITVLLFVIQLGSAQNVLNESANGAKIQSYLACGKPIIASIDGEGAKIVNDANCGVTSPAEDSIALSNIIKELMALDKSKRSEMGNNGRAYYEKEYDRNNLLEKLESIFKS